MWMRFVALFRGINVGGRNTVKMDTLRKMLVGLGYENVRTYIQSGNVLFDAESEPNGIKEKIQAGFLTTFGFDSPVILRAGDELIAIARALPFSAEEIEAAVRANSSVEHLYVYFMDSVPPAELLDTICAGYDGSDRLSVGMREVYLLCYESVRDSKLAVALTKLGVPMTARNWKTLNKLCVMVQDV
jgi:uncharacterized protein (DUF1697 family)